MTIEVTIKNEDTREGHSIEVVATYTSGAQETPVVVAPGAAYRNVVHSGKYYVIRERIETLDTQKPGYEDKYQ